MRIETYNRQTKPLIDFYNSKKQLININGDQPMEKVTEDIFKVLDNL